MSADRASRFPAGRTGLRSARLRWAVAALLPFATGLRPDLAWATDLAAWTLAAARPDGRGVWIRNCVATAEVAGDVTLEQAKHDALLKAKASAARKAFGEAISDSFLDVIFQSGGQTFDATKRETYAEASGMVIDYTEPRYDVKALTVPGPGGKGVQLVQVECTADFLVIEPTVEGKAFPVDLKLDPPAATSGKPLHLRLRAREESYLHVFNLAADLRVYQIYPNQYRPELLAPRGQWLDLPAAEDPFELMPRTLPGHTRDVEVLRAVATRRAVESPRAEADGSVKLRTFYDWLLRLPAGQWSQAEVTYTVRAADKPSP